MKKEFDDILNPNRKDKLVDKYLDNPISDTISEPTAGSVIENKIFDMIPVNQDWKPIKKIARH